MSNFGARGNCKILSCSGMMKSRKQEKMTTEQAAVSGVGLVGSRSQLVRLSINKLLVSFFTNLIF